MSGWHALIAFRYARLTAQASVLGCRRSTVYGFSCRPSMPRYGSAISGLRFERGTVGLLLGERDGTQAGRAHLSTARVSAACSSAPGTASSSTAFARATGLTEKHVRRLL